MTTQEIITRFQLQVDDASELSAAEELDLANEVYTDIQNDRPWEWLKKTYTGSTSTSVPYVSLPTDFAYILQNIDGKAIVFIGTDYQEYEVIPFSLRRNYRDQDGFCYIDISNSRLYFTKQPTEVKSIEYDYIKVASALTLNTSPIFREGFHKIISYGMAAKFNPIELTDKDVSYQKENRIEYLKMLQDMAVEDANIKLSVG